MKGPIQVVLGVGMPKKSRLSVHLGAEKLSVAADFGFARLYHPAQNIVLSSIKDDRILLYRILYPNLGSEADFSCWDIIIFIFRVRTRVNFNIFLLGHGSSYIFRDKP